MPDLHLDLPGGPRLTLHLPDPAPADTDARELAQALVSTKGSHGLTARERALVRRAGIRLP